MTMAVADLFLPDGSSASVVGDALEVRDPIGRVLVRYANGSAEIAVPQGDLVLSAPRGRVVLRSGEEVAVEAPRVSVETDEANAIVRGPVSLLAQRIATSAEVLSQSAERFEVTATRLVEKTREAFRDTAELAQTRVGRARTIVGDVYALFSRRTTMVSNEDTSIDGSKILLG